MLHNKEHISSMIKSSSYDSSTGDLIINFHGGAVYEYKMVTEQDYQLFAESESIGGAFNQHIRKYAGSKLITEENQNEQFNQINS